ncbi:MAG: GNAT family N-acetyltransferase [Chloroflexi bacterium]|nr:GNAT family N-acetyltransferase [Chloroflexota bacterium]
MAAVAQTGKVCGRRIEVEATRDRSLLRAFLEQDRLFAAYALCDLDEREFGRTHWGVAYDEGRPVSVVLEYTGLAPQPLFVMGDTQGVVAILRDVIRPRVGYLASLPDVLADVEQLYRVDQGPPMVRMAVDRTTFRPFPGATARLLPAEIGDLNRLYNLGFTAWLPGHTIVQGVYYGIRIGNRLVAAAGTHVISPEARLGCVGNVMTHTDYRGRGYAKMTTSAVTQDLLRSCDDVVLNVRADNPRALAAYRALGYREHVRFEERLVSRRSTRWDSILAPLRRLFPPARSSE